MCISFPKKKPCLPKQPNLRLTMPNLFRANGYNFFQKARFALKCSLHFEVNVLCFRKVCFGNLLKKREKERL